MAWNSRDGEDWRPVLAWAVFLALMAWFLATLSGCDNDEGKQLRGPSSSLSTAEAMAVGQWAYEMAGIEVELSTGTGDSMLPFVDEKAVLMFELITASEARMGDVISWEHPQRPGYRIMHRVVRRDRDGGVRTMGDNNAEVDAVSVAPSTAVQRLVGVIYTEGR